MDILCRYLLVKEGHTIMGRGQIQLLKAAMECGSLQAAAEKMQMSYSKAWRITKASEEMIGKPLIKKSADQSYSGGSALTEFGEQLVTAFDAFTAEADPLLKALFQQHFHQFIDEG